MRLLLYSLFVLSLGGSSLNGNAFASVATQSRSGAFPGVVVDIEGNRIRGASVTVGGANLTREVKPKRAGYTERHQNGKR